MTEYKIYAKNAVYQKFEVLINNRNKRHKYGEFLIEGVRNINEAVKNGWRINSFIYPQNRELSDWAKNLLINIKTEINYQLAENLMDELSGKTDTSELIAIAAMKTKSQSEEVYSDNPLIVLFDRPSNKGNLGTMIRSCDAFGVDKLIITGHSADIYDPDVISASMGSFFKLPFARLSDNKAIDEFICDLKRKYPNLKTVGTTAHKKTNIYDIDLKTPVLFFIGNETEGLNQHLCEQSDYTATIPMSEKSAATSFNVSCAATVLLYEAVKQRRNPITNL